MTKYTLYVANGVNDLENALAVKFGGVTTTRGRGIWFDGDRAYNEGVNVIVVFVDGSSRTPPHLFDEFVAQHTQERAYVLESRNDAEIRFVTHLRPGETT